MIKLEENTIETTIETAIVSKHDRIELISAIFAEAYSESRQITLTLVDDKKIFFTVNSLEKEDGSGKRFIVSGYSDNIKVNKFYYDFDKQSGRLLID